MRRLLAVASTVLCCGVLAAAIGFYGCGSGGGGGGSDSTDAAPAGKLTLRVTDAPADDLAGVNFCVTGVILKLKTEEEAVAALETEEEEEAPDVVITFAAPKCFDLMDYQGTDADTATFALLDGETVPEGTYGWAKAIVGDAWVELEDGTTEPLTIPARYKGDPTIKIIFAGEDALLVSDGGAADVTVEFDLRCAVILANGSYMLKPVCRVADTTTAGAIEGAVASSALGSDEACKKGYVYVYPGDRMPGDYDQMEGEPAHDNDPMTSVKVAPDKTFGVGFLPAGDYTLAFTCGGKDDDPGEEEAIVFTAVTKVTVPEGETVEVTLEAEPGDEGAGNNLSFPVIWSDGATVTLRGTAGQDPVLGGQFAVIGDQPWYYQQDPLNEWQAENADWSTEGEVNLHWVDWGDNLEAKSWPANQVVRVETVLFQNLDPTMYGYEMSHISGQGITEMWGTNGAAYDSTQATVYSGCARLTIQKLTKARDDETLTVAWDAELGEWTGDVVADGERTTLFKGTVGEAADGPGLYGAEINVSGKVVYGYNWFIKDFTEPLGGPGDYRITFSLDQGACKTGITLNTFITEATAIVVSEEEGETEEHETTESAARALAAAPVEPGGEPDLGGATPALYPEGNLSYIDVRITEPKGSDDHGGGGGPPDGKGPPDGTGGGGGPPEGKGPGAEHGE